MKRKNLLIVLSVLVIFISSAYILSGNGRAGKTGSPGEGTCVDCHAGTLNSGPGYTTISSDMTNWVYTPGQTYHITVTVAEASISLFGVDVEVLKSDNTNAGTFIITNSTETQIKTATISGVVRDNVVQKTDGGLVTTPGSKAFTFDWSAPATDIGKVTFYVTGLAADDDGSVDGDNTYSIIQVVNSPSTSGVNEIPPAINFAVFPNPVSELINMNITINEFGTISASIYTVTGQKVTDLFSETGSPGSFEKQIPVPASVAHGTYLLQLTQNGKTSIQRIEIQ